MVHKLWIVDDDDVYCYTVKRLLQDQSVCGSVTAFSSSDQALAALKDLQNSPELWPDAVLLDINMPVMDGWQFLDAVQKKVPGFAAEKSILMVSSNDSPENRMKAKQHPMIAGFIVKPVNAGILADAFSGLLQN